jgi:hypothetical protein
VKGLVVLAVLALLTSSGCTTLFVALYRPPAVPLCVEGIPPSTALAGEFVRRVRVHVEADRVSEGFEVIAQFREGRLTLVGLTRFGAKAFTVVHSGDEIQIVSFLEPIESVPPVNILADLYRWPFAIEAEPSASVDVEVRADGRAATVVHHRCGYRTTIVDVMNVPGS